MANIQERILCFIDKLDACIFVLIDFYLTKWYALLCKNNI